MPSDTSLEAWFQMGRSASNAADQFEQMADLAKKLALLQADVDRITKMHEYVIEEMEP